MADKSTTRIWISDKEYIDVNENGYVDTWYEGALGCVIPIMRNDNRVAMKLPRLLADTLQENMYIHHLAEVEAEAVYAVTDTVKSPFLLLALGSADDLRGRRRFNILKGDRAEQQDCTIMFSFDKGKSPRVCTLKLVKGSTGKQELFVLPPALKAQMTELFSDSGVAEAVAPVELRAANDALYVTSHREVAVDRKGSLCEVIGQSNKVTTWYSQLPSIKFPWADMTLQESLNQGRLRDWDIGKHAVMLSNLLEALAGLHRHKLLHGDIRPANIMCPTDDAALPSAYRLSDYGSFSSTEIVGAQAAPPTGHTSVGSFVGRHRSSSFYAPERREAVESEAANVAIVIRREKHFIVHLGWRRQLLDGKNPKETVVKALTSVLPLSQSGGRSPGKGEQAKKTSATLLRAGDKLRIRDYLFEVEQVITDPEGLPEPQASGNLTCVCSAHVGHVFNDRMTIYDDQEPVDLPQVIGLPNFIVFRQWSAATDLYSFGALCLYCLLATAVQNSGEEDGDQIRARVDEHFSEMMMVLESESYFRVIWSELEEVRQELEGLSGSEGSIRQPTKLAANQTRFEGIEIPENQRTVGKLAEMTLNNICVNTPNFGVIVKRHFESNSARVVLFMHFVMSCLHRKENLKDPLQLTKPDGAAATRTLLSTGSHLPFALDRAEKPGPGGPAAAALERFGLLKLFLKDERFSAFKVATIPDFSLQSDVDVRAELKKMELKIAAASDFYQSELEKIEKVATAEAAAGLGKGKAQTLQKLIAKLRKEGKQLDASQVTTKNVSAKS